MRMVVVMMVILMMMEVNAALSPHRCPCAGSRVPGTGKKILQHLKGFRLVETRFESDLIRV